MATSGSCSSVLVRCFASTNPCARINLRAVSFKRRIGFTIQCSPFAIRRSPRHSPRHLPLAESFHIHCFQCSLFNVHYSMFASPFAIRRTICHSPHYSPLAATFAVHRSPRRSLRRFIFIFQCSLFKVRYSMFAEPFTIRRAINCRFSMSPDAFHIADLKQQQINLYLQSTVY